MKEKYFNLKLPSKISNIGIGVMAECHFSIGFILSKENRTLKENKKLLKEQMVALIDDMRTGLIHYDFTIDFDQDEVIPMPCTKPNKNNSIPINIYEEDEELIAEIYIGNSIFRPDGDIAVVKDTLYKDIKSQVIDIYDCWKEYDKVEWVEGE